MCSRLLVVLGVLALTIGGSYAIQCMSCVNDCSEQKTVDCTDSISRCLTVFLDKSMGEENLKFKGCAPPGTEGLGCKETITGKVVDWVEKTFGKDIPRGYHCTCSGNFCNSAPSVAFGLSTLVATLATALVGNYVATRAL